MTEFRFIVSYEGKIEAPDADTARGYAIEEVQHDLWPISDVEVERIEPHEHARH